MPVFEITEFLLLFCSIMNHSSDSFLLQVLKQGNTAAYDALFVKYYEMLCVNAFFYLKDAEEAKELVQEFFVDLLEKKGYVHLKGDIKGYLYRSVKNRCLNRLRKQEHDQRHCEQFKWEHTAIFPDEDVEGKEQLYRVLRRTFANLSLQRKSALTLIYVQDKRYQEAADAMGISVNSLKTHLKLALKKLRHALMEYKKA